MAQIADVKTSHSPVKNIIIFCDREQMSPKLGRNALYEGTAEIKKLPPYLVVQMVRFFYKRTAQQKAKILKQVSVSLVDLSPTS